MRQMANDRFGDLGSDIIDAPAWTTETNERTAGAPFTHMVQL